MTTTATPETKQRLSVLGTADAASVSRGGVPLQRGIHGVEVKPIRPHLDPRGTLSEVINFDDPFWREPIVYAYSITVNPGRIKGWALHERQADRQHVICGNVRFVLFDAREDSPTHGQLSVHNLGDEARGILRIPCGVWHAAQAWGNAPAHITNYPTIPYDHANPDKRMLPLDTDEIPFDFSDFDAYVR